MLAKTNGLEPGTLNWSIKDAHIYVNQIEGIKEQINRMDTLGDFEAPELWLNPEVEDFYDYDNSKECKDVKVLKYKNHGKINFKISQ
jgi:thymidylate synthase